MDAGLGRRQRVGVTDAGVRELVYADRVGALAAGRVWVLVPLWMAFGPAAAHRLRIRS